MQICNFHKRKFVFLLALCVVSFSYAQNAFYLRAGHRVSIVLLTELDSQQRPTSPSAVVAADVYDDSGAVLLIRKGTSVLVQVQCRKASLSGDVGQISVLPISTQAVNGREITFVAEPAVWEGAENEFFRSQKKVVVPVGTAFVASIANTYCFRQKNGE